MSDQSADAHRESVREWSLLDEATTSQFGASMARALDDGMVIYLEGPLGAGKTSVARALLIEWGVGERVKSPTYSLVENYVVGDRAAWHLDLYRIADPGELEWLGLDAMADQSALILVEWSERGAGALPAPDIELRLAYAPSGTGRVARLQAFTTRGKGLLSRLR